MSPQHIVPVSHWKRDTFRHPFVLKSSQWAIQITVASYNPIPWRKMIPETKKKLQLLSLSKHLDSRITQHLQARIPTLFIRKIHLHMPIPSRLRL